MQKDTREYSTSWVIQSLKKLGLEEKYINIMKPIYDKTIDKNIQNGKN
jgi:hypothetical protein